MSDILKELEHQLTHFSIVGDNNVRVVGDLRTGLAVNLDEVVAAEGEPPPPATGACCVEGDCTIETEEDCTGLGGIYQGDDTECDPNPCEFCAISTIEITTRIYGSYDGLPDDTGAGICSFSFDATEFRTYTAVDGTPGDGEFNVDGLDPDCVINLPLDRIIFDVSGFVSGCADTCDDDPEGANDCPPCSPHMADICTNEAHNLPESNCIYAQMDFGISSNFADFGWAGRVSCDDTTGEDEDCNPFSLDCGTGFSHSTETETIAAVADTLFFTYSQVTNGVSFNFEVFIDIS